MSKPHTNLIVVSDHGDMVGVLTKTDIVGQIGRCAGAGSTAKVDSIMTRDVPYCQIARAWDVLSLSRGNGSWPWLKPIQRSNEKWAFQNRSLLPRQMLGAHGLKRGLGVQDASNGG